MPLWAELGEWGEVRVENHHPEPLTPFPSTVSLLRTPEKRFLTPFPPSDRQSCRWPIWEHIWNAWLFWRVHEILVWELAMIRGWLVGIYQAPFFSRNDTEEHRQVTSVWLVFKPRTVRYRAANS
jgi:hypothetical protein